MRTLMANSMSKHGFSCWILVLSAVITGTLLPGCAGNQESLARSGYIELEKHPSDKIYIAWCDAHKDENGLIVTGVLKRRDRVGLAIKAHVDVKVMSSDGSILQEGCSEDIYVPRRITGKGQSPKRFQISFSEVPPEGSTLRLSVEVG